MNQFKRETANGCDKYEIKAKWVYNKHRAKDYRIVVRSARRKNKQNLKNELIKEDKEKRY